MLTNAEIAQFYAALDMKNSARYELDYNGWCCLVYAPLDANEIERLMPAFTATYGQITIYPPLPKKCCGPNWTGNKWCVRHTIYSGVSYGDTFAEAVVRWVLAQEEEG